MRLLLFLICLTSGIVSARPVPEWLAGHEALLPEVSDATIETLRQALPHSRSDEFTDINNPFSEQVLAAAKAIASLGHEASKAMIWLYAEDPPQAQYTDFRVHMEKARRLRSLALDTDAARWLVPILRRRLDWAEPVIASKTLDQTWFSALELGAIEGVLTIQGTDEDLRRVEGTLEALRASPWGSTVYPLTETPEQRWANAMWRRETYLKKAAPYGNEYRRILSMPQLGLLAPPPAPGAGPAAPALLPTTENSTTQRSGEDG